MRMAGIICAEANDIGAPLRILPHNVVHLPSGPIGKVGLPRIFAIDQGTHLSRCIVARRPPDGEHFEARRSGSKIACIAGVLVRNIRPVFKVPARNIPESGIVSNMGEL